MERGKGYSYIPQTTQQFKERYIVLAMVFAVLYVPFIYLYGYKGLHAEAMDLPSYWCAAKAAFRLSLSPYSRDVLQRILPSQHVYACVYAPPSLLVFYPLSFVPYEWARIATLALNHVVVLVLLWFLPFKLLKLSVQRDTSLILLGFVYILTFQPLVTTMALGQDSLLLACAIFMFWHLARSNLFFWASVALTFAILLKVHPLVLLFPLIICKKHKVVLYTAILLAGVSLLCSLLIPSQSWRDWFVDVLPSMRYGGGFPPAALGNVSINGFVSHLFLKTVHSPHPIVDSPALAAAVGYGATAVVFLLSLYAVRKRFVIHPVHSFDWAMLIILPMICLVSPVSWDHHLIYLLAGLLMLLNLAAAGKLGSIKLSAFVLLCAITISVQGAARGKLLAILGIWAVSLFLAVKSQHDRLDRPSPDLPPPIERYLLRRPARC